LAAQAFPGLDKTGPGRAGAGRRKTAGQLRRGAAPDGRAEWRAVPAKNSKKKIAFRPLGRYRSRAFADRMGGNLST